MHNYKAQDYRLGSFLLLLFPSQIIKETNKQMYAIQNMVYNFFPMNIINSLYFLFVDSVHLSFHFDDHTVNFR